MVDTLFACLGSIVPSKSRMCEDGLSSVCKETDDVMNSLSNR